MCDSKEKTPLNKDTSETAVDRFFCFSTIFSSLFLLIFFILYFGFLFINWGLTKNFFGYFAKDGIISLFFLNGLTAVKNNPTITTISILVAVGVVFFYIMLSIKDKGYLFYEAETFEGKYFKSFLLIAAIVISSFTLPFLWFLKDFGLECCVLVIFLLITIFAVCILGFYFQILNEYEKISKFKLSLQKVKPLKHFAFLTMNIVPNSLILLMFFVFFGFLGYYNLLTILLIEICLFWDYFIFCSITHNVEGPLNIVLNDADRTVFEDVYIAENSSNGYILITIKGQNQKKIMTSSVLYMEISDSNNPK